MGLHLPASARTDTVEVPVDIKLRQVSGIVAWTALIGRLNPLESSSLKVKAVNECINETDRIIRSHVVVHSIGQKQKLGPIFTSDVCHDAGYQMTRGT